jgi:hypothetical protein
MDPATDLNSRGGETNPLAKFNDRFATVNMPQCNFMSKRHRLKKSYVNFSNTNSCIRCKVARSNCNVIIWMQMN